MPSWLHNRTVSSGLPTRLQCLYQPGTSLSVAKLSTNVYTRRLNVKTALLNAKETANLVDNHNLLYLKQLLDKRLEHNLVLANQQQSSLLKHKEQKNNKALEVQNMVTNPKALEAFCRLFSEQLLLKK
jgi:hypothetical protein